MSHAMTPRPMPVAFDPRTASAIDLYAHYTVEDRSPAEDFAALRDDMLSLGRGSPSARVAVGWVDAQEAVVVLEDGTYLTRHWRDGQVEWIEGTPVARTFRAATQGR